MYLRGRGENMVFLRFAYIEGQTFAVFIISKLREETVVLPFDALQKKILGLGQFTFYKFVGCFLRPFLIV